MEAIAAEWIAEHPEYAADLADSDAAVAASYTVEEGRTNPFLHLAMHLSVSEQVSIDQPHGIKQAVELLATRRGSLHEAHHEVMDDLGLATQWPAPRRTGVHRLRETSRHELSRRGDAVRIAPNAIIRRSDCPIKGWALALGAEMAPVNQSSSPNS
jgi:hypothetical protein